MGPLSTNLRSPGSASHRRDRAGYRWVAGLPAATLRELAAPAERRQRREFIDPERAATELAEMLAAGDRPTIGWYRRHAPARHR